MITILYVKSDSINRSYTALYKEISQRREADLRVVDVSSVSLDQLKAFCADSELLVVDNFIRVANAIGPEKLSSVMISNWRGAGHYEGVWQVATAADSPILYIASGWDLHWPGPDLDELLSRISCVAWLYERAPITLPQVPDAYRDAWMENHTDPMANWEKVCSRVQVRIELMHSLARSEFKPGPARATWDVCIAGDTYKTRMVAKESSVAARLREAPFRVTDYYIIRFTDEVSFLFGNSKSSWLRNKLRQTNQVFFTHNSAVNFVCGSGYRYPVRKFFEIPAVRSAMLSYPCMGMRDYGFVDGEHYLQIVPEDFGREARKLLSNEAVRSRLTGNAWQMVSRLHSVEKRVDDLIKCMRLMAKGRLRSARFHEGEFVIEQCG